MSNQYYALDESIRSPMGPLEIDVSALYSRMPIGKDTDAYPNYVPLFSDGFHRFIYRNRLIPLKHRIRLRGLLRKTGMDDLWLNRFQNYWTQLGGRPLWHTSDFFFLRNFYRLRQLPPSDNQITDDAEHLKAWQDPQYLFALFHTVLKETFLSPEKYVSLALKYCPQASSVLEFGAGAALITSALLEFKCLAKDAQFLIADIPTLTFHYAGYKVRKCSNVEAVILSLDQNFQLQTDRKFDVIFCCQVFEHLNEPLETVGIFHQCLKPGGILIFDYIKSAGKGLDSLQGVRDRAAVLGFITKNFNVEYGTADPAKDVGLAVARKLN